MTRYITRKQYAIHRKNSTEYKQLMAGMSSQMSLPHKDLLHKVTLQSGTHDFVDVTISDMDNRNQITFSFDFWTKELCFDGYNNYDERDSIVKAFRSIYRNISITDEPWEEDEKFYLPMLDNEEYDQETVRSEYETLLSRKVA